MGIPIQVRIDHHYTTPRHDMLQSHQYRHIASQKGLLQAGRGMTAIHGLSQTGQIVQLHHGIVQYLPMLLVYIDSHRISPQRTTR